MQKSKDQGFSLQEISTVKSIWGTSQCKLLSHFLAVRSAFFLPWRPCGHRFHRANSDLTGRLLLTVLPGPVGRLGESGAQRSTVAVVTAAAKLGFGCWARLLGTQSQDPGSVSDDCGPASGTLGSREPRRQALAGGNQRARRACWLARSPASPAAGAVPRSSRLNCRLLWRPIGAQPGISARPIPRFFKEPRAPSQLCVTTQRI